MLKSPYQEEFYWVNLQIFSEMHGVFKFDDTAYILIKNIDQRKKNEFLIEERNQKLNHILENSSSPIVEFDKNTKFIYINKPAKEILGIKPEELENANYKDYVHPDDLDSFSDIENSVKNNIIYSKPFTVTNRIKTVNQGYRWYEWNVNVMYENGEILRRISVGRDVTEQLDQQDKINYEITHDPLTGLYNSNYLKEQLTKIGENEFTFCVFINIDNFRRINDSFGHKFGDEFLVQFSKRLKLMIPDRYVKLIAHVSGDEFAILSNLKSQKHNHVHEDFEEYLEKINLMPITCFGEQIPFTISVGYAEYPYSTTDPTEIFRFSEIAMFEAKKNKRNGIATFDKSLYKKRVHAQMITKEVQYSNFSNDFFLVFHPITNFENENLIFFEALLRWKHPEKGVVSPSEFIDIIEQSGQLIEISRVMIHKLCHQIMDWSKLTDKEIAVSYNLSVASLRIKDEAEYIINELKKHNIPGDKLIIEITESLFYEENISIKNNISQLKEYGIKIAIDDFGMNFSTLSMLDRIAYDIIKIDMYFTQNINNPTSNMLIQMIHNIASINNKRCIVEGIESIDQYNLLKEIGITEFQGHYFSKPLTEEDITHNLQKYQSIYQKQKQK
jgi:diguanylate cyclase (GGDEF)-like protein/PAS domain S-box-containing protein